ncbi:MAG: cupin domain-containing protein [Burkholderiaceae bacterium]|jgi:3-methylfumaryl-CoA hydratase|nr:MAG: cupin domain-containing protein [Burkholderiaceae bacterium]
MSHGRSESGERAEPDKEPSGKPNEHRPQHAATLDAAALAELQQWVGRSETLQGEISAAPLAGLSAALDRDEPEPVAGTPLPPLAHWLYFLPHARQSELGPDGHPRRGGFLPPVPLPRRMWAGGRLAWEPGNPLCVGDAATRVSTVASVEHKRGRSGDLVFVRVAHVLGNASGPCLTEEHDIVYRAAAAAAHEPQGSSVAPTAADADAPWRREIVPDAVLLFRYSALTFNGHRIHYDQRYVTETEGYPGLVVHGPLIATLLADLVRREMPQAFMRRFEFRALRPTFVTERRDAMAVRGRPSADGHSARLWAVDHEGWLTMQATADLE